MCRDLVKGLLRKDPGARLTARQVLEHPWITAESLPTVAPKSRKKKQREQERQQQQQQQQQQQKGGEGETAPPAKATTGASDGAAGAEEAR
jgi:serine/threonine protein kinase